MRTMATTDVGGLERTCFFCSKPIEDKKSKEHIIPDFLLARMGIKNETITGERTVEYAKVKVPAHRVCNSEFGSIYENTIRAHLGKVQDLHEALKAGEQGILLDYGPSDSPEALLSTWLSKIYYGLFYFDLLRTKDPEWRSVCAGILSTDNFRMIQRSYAQTHGFCLPSSLYAFWSTSKQSFDLRTCVDPAAILIKIDELVLILAVADGFLAKSYLAGETLANLRAIIEEKEQANPDFPGYLVAWAEVLALRKCIPKSPYFVYSDDRIINMSLSTMVRDPASYYRLDEERLSAVRRAVLDDLRIIIPGL
jgi:hypothetical protein